MRPSLRLQRRLRAGGGFTRRRHCRGCRIYFFTEQPERSDCGNKQNAAEDAECGTEAGTKGSTEQQAAKSETGKQSEHVETHSLPAPLRVETRDAAAASRNCHESRPEAG